MGLPAGNADTRRDGGKARGSLHRDWRRTRIGARRISALPAPVNAIDIPHSLETMDSLNRGSMPRTAHQDVASCVHVAVMLRAAATHPSALIQTRTPFRAGDHAACVADLGCVSLIDFLERSSVRNRLIAEHVSKGRPAGVKNGLRHAGSGEPGRVHVAHGDVVEAAHDSNRGLVQMISPRVCDSGVDVDGLPLLIGALGGGEFGRESAHILRILDLLAGAQCRKVFEAKIDTDALLDCPSFGYTRLDDDIQEPVASRIAGEIRAILDLGASRQVSTFEYSELAAVEMEAVGGLADVASLDRNPAQTLASAVAQEWSLLRCTALSILFAHGVDGAGVQADLLAAAGGEIIKVEAGQPSATKPECILLPVIAIVPHERHGACLPVQQTIQ